MRAPLASGSQRAVAPVPRARERESHGVEKEEGKPVALWATSSPTNPKDPGWPCFLSQSRAGLLAKNPSRPVHLSRTEAGLQAAG